MNFIWAILALSIFTNDCLAKKKKLDLDFEFVDKVEKDVQRKRKQWIYDPKSDLCQPLNCKKRELCLLEDAFTALCVSKAMLHKNRDEIISVSTQKVAKVGSDGNDNIGSPKFSDEIYLTDDYYGNSKKCKPCPSGKQTSFVCGSDNRTYSSGCRLDYHNCVHNSPIKVNCKGFCPCKVVGECAPQELTTIGNRLLDWFSVIMTDTKKQKRRIAKSEAHFPAACKIEAKWMFGHLDINNDGSLSTSELFDLEHDQNERCIKPFIDTCDVDNDGALSTREWCRCFEKTDRPCAAVRRRIKYDLLAKDAYVPDCDMQGFYRPTQCHSKIGICWCVDKHGVEFANTRKRGRPTCDEVTKNVVSQPSDDEDDDDLDYDDAEASANGPLNY
ncbi:proteoglycan Cow [Sitodiplosis mosellana]|uniref:proteoglycan Cow n=1 Tax=Sitodiplosis mosellana TaxID=263140 RepID=UPI0024449F13|nr:proteoglycan Cow [Sitodiplosis mosellana]